MKRIVALIVTVALLCAALPITAVQAFSPDKVYGGVDGCKLMSISLPQTLNPWLMWNVLFETKTETNGRVYETTSAHPNLIGRAAIFSLTFQGSRVTFNGSDIIPNETAVLLQEKNDLVVWTAEGTRAEYEVSITEVNHGLPVVAINTSGVPVTSKEEYVTSVVSIYGGSTAYSLNDVYAATAGVKLRGNSTMGYDKKPYRIKFDSKQKVLDMGKAKSWTLIANYLDPSQMRNRIAYSFASKMTAMSFAPRMRPVEVYMNGTYLGMYDLGDHIQVNSLRIDIPEDESLGLDTSTIGFHLEVEARAASDTDPYFAVYAGGTSQAEMFFQIKSPSDTLSQAQTTYIQSYIENINSLFLARDSRVWDYVDMASVVDWYLSNEIFANADSCLCSSCIMYKVPDTVDEFGNVTAVGKLYFGPVWDFDISMGGVNAVQSPTNWRTRLGSYSQWFPRMFEMSEFSNAVSARYAEVRQTAIEEIFTDIDAFTAEFFDAAQVNQAKWFQNFVNHQSSASWDSAPWLAALSGYEQQPQFIKDYMWARINWMDQEFGVIGTQTTLYGHAVVSGVPEYNETLTALTGGILPEGSSFRYQWLRNGATISGATSSTYTVTQTDIGCELSVKVTSRRTSGTITSNPVTIRKTSYTYATQQKPVLISKTADTIVLNERTGYEFSVDGVNWQVSGTFTGLSPNTYYRCVCRHGETTTREPGQAGSPLQIITDISNAPVYQQGDVDRDNTITSADARLVLSYSISESGLDDQQLGLADFNLDGDINTLDVRGILTASLLG